MNQMAGKLNSHYVEFYPSSDDYAYIALRVSDRVKVNSFSTYAFYAFLASNVVLFPATLIIKDNFRLALLVFAIEVATVLFLMPRVNSDRFKTYYSQLFSHREKRIASVDINETGLTYKTGGCVAFWPWDRVTNIEETEQAIYFFSDTNGLAVRKNGFAYSEDATQFVAYSRSAIDSVTTEKLH